MAASDMQALLAAQRRAFRHDGYPALEVRLDRLDRLARMVIRHEREIVDTLSADFGVRSPHSTCLGDVVGGVNAIRYNREHLAAWMQPEALPLPAPLQAAGARAEVQHHPLGVVGVIVPWNGPVLMSCLAAAGVLAAGNRMMLKVPELAPQTSALLERMFGEHFDTTEVAVVQGGAEVGAAFSRLPFDHLLYTGSSAIARHVMRAAAENLVPVTLELGGRNPVVIGASADLPTTVARLVTGKMASAGQVCVSPDIVHAPRGTGVALIEAMAAQAARLYPTLLDNDDYTSIISDRHFARLVHLLEDARQKGASVVEVNPAREPVWTSDRRKFPLCLLSRVTPDMRVMQEETFGPLLCVVEYDSIAQALSDVAEGGAALSGYYFGNDAAEERAVLQGIRAGNIVVNDVRSQLFFEQLPFGGVGTAGMGRYRGQAGFRTFSNPKTVLHQIASDQALAGGRPPYSDATRTALAQQVAALRASIAT